MGEQGLRRKRFIGFPHCPPPRRNSRQIIFLLQQVAMNCLCKEGDYSITGIAACETAMAFSYVLEYSWISCPATFEAVSNATFELISDPRVNLYTSETAGMDTIHNIIHQ